MEPDDPGYLQDPYVKCYLNSRRVRLRGLTRLSPEGVGQTQNILQAEKDHRESSLESLSSANHSSGAHWPRPQRPSYRREWGASRQTRIIPT
ncbi:unnamed protein product [Cyprideis torosa]|uniref:Uncharacterized protein n=1 Tax=Cyprideis torosa TaxID=163714 RepID=A0A7R8WUF1_9CRUS|nr:unnamed protein product [Cyprideis torosa]CAG0906715.1 unnamed protein product [Cyprideis torosa]